MKCLSSLKNKRSLLQDSLDVLLSFMIRSENSKLRLTKSKMLKKFFNAKNKNLYILTIFLKDNSSSKPLEKNDDRLRILNRNQQ